MKEEKTNAQANGGHDKQDAVENISATLAENPLKGCLKQVHAYGLIDTEKESEPKFRQVTIGLCMHHPQFPDIELVINPSDEGVTLLIPKTVNLSSVQMMRAYKKACGALRVEFKVKPERVIRRERRIEQHEALLSWGCE